MDKASKIFTVVGIYNENKQRFSPDPAGPTPTDAVLSAFRSARGDNNEPECMITVFAVFEGDHPAQDTAVSQADERPEREQYSAHAPMLPFTVVMPGGIMHVEAVNAIEAELCATEGDDDDVLVAGVLSGHLDSLGHEVDWERVERETAVPDEEDTPEVSAGAQAPLEMRLCEATRLILRPNQPYIFTVDRSCQACLDAEARAAT